MSDETNAELELETAHVLFIDAVGFSKLSINEQRELFDSLNRVVRETPRFRTAADAGKLTRLPTGDGMALLFSDDPQSPLQCAIEIARACKDSHLPLRMGIHSGPVSRVVDVNNQSNAAGSGINVAQRVMSCGDSGHILLSRRVADDLAEHNSWRPALHDIGECEVKHGTSIGLVNFYRDDAGNPELPARLRQARKKRLTVSLVGSIVVALLLGLFLVERSRLLWRPRAKSIAVLPFTNFGSTEENAAVTDGLHDEILTDLSKVADLKVVSRTSVMQYRSPDRNIREIAKQLGVANILEGSVQFFGNRVKVTAQLIDARSDTHIWANKYEGNLADVFAMEGEVAKKIVAQLQSRLSPKEKAALEEQPTADFVAYDIYVRAKDLIDHSVFNPGKEELVTAVDLLNQAIGRDSSFALAYYQLAHAHDQIYLRGFDHTPARLALGEAAIQALQRLRPNSGEAHLALAKHLYWGYRDYDHARQELLLARLSLPNDPLSYLLLGYIDRRQGRWKESVSNMEYALELDPKNPQNVFILQQLAKTHECLRDYRESIATLKRALALDPKDPIIRVQMAQNELAWKADTQPLHQVMQTIVAEDPSRAVSFARERHFLAICERDAAAASAAAGSLTSDGCYDEAIPFPTGWCEGQVALLRGDLSAARQSFETARDELVALVKDQPENGPALTALGVIDAALGHNESAVQEGRRGLELLPPEKDSINGALLQQYLAVIYASTGNTDLALSELDKAARVPGYLSYGQLRLHPFWDSIRNQTRFEKIVGSLAPK